MSKKNVMWLSGFSKEGHKFEKQRHVIVDVLKIVFSVSKQLGLLNSIHEEQSMSTELFDDT